MLPGMPVPLEQLQLFLVGSILITVVPGADMALVMRQVFIGGTSLAQRTIFGNLTGLVVHAVALAAGLSALLATSAEAYTVVKLAGAAYLVYLGLHSILQARRGEPESEERTRPLRGSPYRQGLISTVLNPKPALFFLSYLPQFVDRDANVTLQVAFLAAIHILVGLVWLTAYASLVSRMHAALTRPHVRAAMARVTGVVLVALGLRVALSHR